MQKKTSVEVGINKGFEELDETGEKEEKKSNSIIFHIEERQHDSKTKIEK